MYCKGELVTQGGSLWYAREATDAKPGEAPIESRAWQLVAKRGADGKDLQQLMRPDSPTFSLSKPMSVLVAQLETYFVSARPSSTIRSCWTARRRTTAADGVADAVEGSDGPPPVQIRRGNRPSRRPPRFSNASGIASTGTRNDGRRVRLSGLPADVHFSPRRSNSFSPRATWRRRDGASVVENADEHKPARRRLTAAASGRT